LTTATFSAHDVGTIFQNTCLSGKVIRRRHHLTKSENYGRKLHLRPLKTLHCFIISNSLCIGAELNGRHAVWMVAVKCCRICVCYIRERRHRWQSGRRSLSRHQQQNGLYANFSFILPSEL